MTFAIHTPEIARPLGRSARRLSHIAVAATLGAAVAVGATLAITDSDAPTAGGRTTAATPTSEVQPASVASVPVTPTSVPSDLDESLGIPAAVEASAALATLRGNLVDELQFGSAAVPVTPSSVPSDMDESLGIPAAVEASAALATLRGNLVDELQFGSAAVPVTPTSVPSDLDESLGIPGGISRGMNQFAALIDELQYGVNGPATVVDTSAIFDGIRFGGVS